MPKPIPKLRPSSMMVKSTRLANSLYRAYIQEEKRECGGLLLEWIDEHFWGRLVKDNIRFFDGAWEMLHKRGHTRKNKFVYGDIDQGVWVEYPKGGNKRVIVSTCYCSCASDNTHLFIEEGAKYRNTRCDMLYRFRIVTVWPRERKGKYGFDYIDAPSLNTHRKDDYHYGYFDCRDKGHVLLLNGFRGARAEKAHWSAWKIRHALWTLRMHYHNLDAETS